MKDVNLEVDLDDDMGISGIKSICVDKKHFYILANKLDKRLGLYLYQLD